MSWINTSFENAMQSLFILKMGDIKGDELFGEYTSIRNAMVRDNFFKETKGVAPNLSDHSERHVQDVFERAYRLIGDNDFKGLSVYEVYCLSLMILFHDVGIIYGRDNHEAIERIADVHKKYRETTCNYRDERRVVSMGASAHSGCSKAGCKNTLKYVQQGSLKGESINLQELASVLRFADELAEGPQRTCSFMAERDLIDSKSKIYHKYAEITSINIDRKLGRVALSYHIDIPKNMDNCAQRDLEELLRFTFYRAIKLNMERVYTKFYSDLLKAFKCVTVQYNFSKNEIPLEIDFDRVIFEDECPVPGQTGVNNANDAECEFVSKYPKFKIADIVETLRQA